MTIIQSILSLHAQRWSRRRIAVALGIDRGTVGRHLRQASQAAQPDAAETSNAAIAPMDPARVAADSQPAITPIGSLTGVSAAIQPAESAHPKQPAAGRQSNAEPWRELPPPVGNWRCSTPG
jgi:hypothetical protein